ncbi:MAG: hypothetical protein Q8N03_10560 [Ignavibacteria bacterium]|nr:hypothetical protein [Ignavibacteria bacterium]
MKIVKTYRLEISKAMVFSALENTFSYPENERINFFMDLRNCFYLELNKKIIESEIPLLTEPLANYTQLGTGKIIETHPIEDEYHSSFTLLQSLATRGFEFDSMSSSNRERDITYFPSYYPFANFDSFSIGNFAFPVVSENYDIEITSEDGIYFNGYSHHISSRKRKCYFSILGLFLSKELLTPITKKYYSDYILNINDLDEINFNYAGYPILFINRVTGKLYTCNCFENYFKVRDDISRLSYSFEKIFVKHIKQIEIVNGICHICTHKTPKLNYWGQSVFQKKYYPYFELYRRKIYGNKYPNWRDILPEREKENEIENIVRKIFCFPPIGKLGINENILFKIIDEIFMNEEVIHHYRGKEFEGLEIDIFIPSRKLAVECQGEQHYEEFKHLGGKEGLRKRQLNDKRKKIICEKHNYQLLEFYTDTDPYTYREVYEKIKPYL